MNSSVATIPDTALADVTAKAITGGVHFGGLTLERRGLLLLKELSATVAAGETLAVIGRSGAGKTTLLRTIAGLAPTNGGTVDRAEGRVPIVFQEPRLLPWRTALENVELVLGDHERDKALDWLTRVGLGDAVNAYPLTLSGGMRQRVAIARALACQAPLLLVDEPFSNLDVVTATRLRAELTRQIEETGTTAVWVTHDPHEAAQVAHRTLLMHGPPHGTWRFIPHEDRSDTAGLAADLAGALALHALPES